MVGTDRTRVQKWTIGSALTKLQARVLELSLDNEARPSPALSFASRTSLCTRSSTTGSCLASILAIA